tara:strand:+ start:2726 stop:2932 length:207 start_codon:yes stop_codon:yes gene_type:complete
MFKIFDNLTVAENFTLFLYGKKIKNGAPEIIKVKARTQFKCMNGEIDAVKLGRIIIFGRCWSFSYYVS